MDFVFIGSIGAFALLIWAMAAGCGRLGGKQWAPSMWLGRSPQRASWCTCWWRCWRRRNC